MSAILGSLGKILGLIDGRIDLGAITGIFERIADVIDEGQELAKEFRGDPRITAYLAKVRGLLKLPGGETISKEEIVALRKRWAGNAEPVYDRPKQTTPPPPAEPPPPAPSSRLPYGDVLGFDPRNDPRFLQTDHVYQSKANRSKFVATDGRIGGGFTPNENFPLVVVDGQEVGGDWKQVHPVVKE